MKRHTTSHLYAALSGYDDYYVTYQKEVDGITAINLPDDIPGSTYTDVPPFRYTIPEIPDDEEKQPKADHHHFEGYSIALAAVVAEEMKKNK